MTITWKMRAVSGWNLLQKLKPELVDEFLDRHYSGGGGCLFPSGAICTTHADDDVAYESLADDCEFELEAK